MKKIRKQKVICVFACIFLLASFFALPFTVSAAETDPVYISQQFDMDLDVDIAIKYRTIQDSWDFVLDTVNRNTFAQLNQMSGSLDIERFEGDYDYDYYYFDVDDYPTALYSGGVFSMAFIDSPVLDMASINWNYAAFRLSAGFMNYFCQDVEVYGLRFSIREFSVATSTVGAVTHASTLFPPGWSSTATNSNPFYRYRRNIDTTLYLKSVTSGALLPRQYVFCVDILFNKTPYTDSHPSHYGFGFSTDTYFYGNNVVSSLLPTVGQSSLDAWLNMPQYVVPDYGFMQDTSDAQNKWLGFFDGSNLSFAEMVSSLKTLVPQFAGGFYNIVSLLDYFVASMPVFNFIIIFGLVIGLFAFVLSFSNSSSQAKDKNNDSKSDTELSHSNAKG